MKIEELLDGESRTRFQDRVLKDLDLLEELIESGRLCETHGEHLGVEQELQFIGSDNRVAWIGEEVQSELDDERYTEELARFNFEIVLPPTPFETGALSDIRSQLDGHLTTIRGHARRHGGKPVLCGIVPSVKLEDISEEALTPKPRYRSLHAARHWRKTRANYEYNFHGLDSLTLRESDALLDGVFTSLQLHIQIEPTTAANSYNWAQLIAAPCLAASCASPIFLQKRLWHETRIPLFEQTSDTRMLQFQEDAAFPPRAFLGNRWIEHIHDIWRHDISVYPPLLGLKEEEDSSDADGLPELSALQFFNGTVYRWNRLCYGAGKGSCHLRIESRYMPAGLTLIDEMANSALWFGLMSNADTLGEGLAHDLSFDRVIENFRRAARDGMESQLIWRDGRAYSAGQLLEDVLVPLAIVGLEKRGIENAEAWLQPILERARTGQTASRWQLSSYEALLANHSPEVASERLTKAITDFSETGEPVHSWPIYGRRELYSPAEITPKETTPTPLRGTDSLSLARHRLDWEERDALPVRLDSNVLFWLDRARLSDAKEDELVVADLFRTGELTEARQRGGARLQAFDRSVYLNRRFAIRKSENPGPLFVITVGVHGNELNGVASIDKWLDRLEPHCGTVAVIFGNIKAMAHGRRFIDRDMNRVFTEEGLTSDTQEAEEANELLDCMSELKASYGHETCWHLDLHGTSAHAPPYLSAMKDISTFPLLKTLPVPSVTNFESMFTGTLVERAIEKGWKSVTYEAGCFHAPISVENGISLLSLIADDLGLVSLTDSDRERLSDSLSAQSPTISTYEFCHRHEISPTDEFVMRPGFVSFQQVHENEILADDTNGTVRAPVSGRLLMPLYQKQGDDGFFIVTERQIGEKTDSKMETATA